jgi:integron integrase
MSNSPSTHTDRPRPFWDRYLEKLRESGVEPAFERWMLVCAQQYIAAHPDQRLAEQSPAAVEAYLAGLGRERKLKDRQIRQTVDAIRMLFVLADVQWQTQVDWERWRGATARGRAQSQPSAARGERMDAAGSEGGDGECASFADIRQTQGALLDLVSDAIRARGLAVRTEQTYLHWIMRFIGHLGNRDPNELGPEAVADFLEHLSQVRKVSASTRNLALNALVFLYEQVLPREDLGIDRFARAKREPRLPTVLTDGEATALLRKLSAPHWLMASLMYRTGMRLMECVRLRVMDIDFVEYRIAVRNAQGGKDRTVPLPTRLAKPLSEHLAQVRELHAADLRDGLGEVDLPELLTHRYPNAAKEWRSQYVFPSGRLSADPNSGVLRRHHLHENALQKAVNRAAREAGIAKRVGTQTLRHSCAIHLLQTGHDIRSVQELLGHSDPSTTTVYTQILSRG